MRVIVLGGTRFVGRAVVHALVGAGHDVLVVHRGQHEPPDLPDVPHLHVDHAALADHRDRLAGFEPDASVDLVSMGPPAATAVVDALPADIRLVVISSGDVYRAYHALHRDRWTDAVPLAEDAPLRREDAGEWFVDGPAWENNAVEAAYAAAGGTALRLGAVAGPHDYQRRHEAVLRRLRGGRSRMPVGSGQLLFNHVHVDDVAAAVTAVLAAPEQVVRGRAFNVAEWPSPSIGLRLRTVLDVLGADLELVPVPDDVLPQDLRITRSTTQHLLMDPTAARELLGWRPRGWRDTIADAVAWEWANPPEDEWYRAATGGAGDDFSADDAALAS